MSDSADAPPGTPRDAPPSTIVFPDVYLPETLARTLAERALAAKVSPGAFLASVIERFVQEHASEALVLDLTDAENGAPEDDWDAPGMVRRIVPLPEQLAQAVTQLALVRRRSANALIRDIVQAALDDCDDAPFF